MTDTANQPARYWAYSNYVIAISRLIRHIYPAKSELANKLAHMRGMKKITGGKVLNFPELEKTLRLAWNTELLIQQSLEYPAILPYSIPWSMVQSYYAIYAAIRAYFNALGRYVEETHQATLKTIGTDLVSCKERFPEPWCCVLESFSENSCSAIGNIAAPITITLTNPLLSPYFTDPWQYFGLFLRSTHQRKIERAIKLWKKKSGRKRILKAERIQIIDSCSQTTIFDALYRMRSRSNYQDVDSFIFSEISVAESTKLQKAFVIVVSSTLMTFEFIIAKAIGKKKFEKIVLEFVSTSNGKPAVNTVLSRWKAMEVLL